MSPPDPTARAHLLQRLAELTVDRSPGSPRRHKPLVLLYALAQLRNDGRDELTYEQVKEAVVPLLELFVHPTRGRHQVYDPFGRLATRDKSGRPAAKARLASRAGAATTLADRDLPTP